jgi:hypothetical protein
MKRAKTGMWGSVRGSNRLTSTSAGMGVGELPVCERGGDVFIAVGGALGGIAAPTVVQTTMVPELEGSGTGFRDGGTWRWTKEGVSGTRRRGKKLDGGSRRALPAAVGSG